MTIKFSDLFYIVSVWVYQLLVMFIHGQCKQVHRLPLRKRELFFVPKAPDITNEVA